MILFIFINNCIYFYITKNLKQKTINKSILIINFYFSETLSAKIYTKNK